MLDVAKNKIKQTKKKTRKLLGSFQQWEMQEKDLALGLVGIG